MIGYPLDSHVTYKEDGTPVWDRAISSAPYRKLIRCLFSDGVLPNPSTNLQVLAGEGLRLRMLSGFAICNGCQKLQEEEDELVIPAASVSNSRIDTVVLRLNDNDDVRECEFYVVSGIPAATPVRPELTRNDSVWELGIADILVRANASQINDADITDTRYDAERCGVISSISEFDTTTLYQQIQSDLSNFREITQADILEWFDNMKEKLSEDAAGNLQNQIGMINKLGTDAKSNIVDAINEIWENVTLANAEGQPLVDTSDWVTPAGSDEPVRVQAMVQEKDTGQWCYIRKKIPYREFNQEWISHQLEFNSHESKQIFESFCKEETIYYTGPTEIEGEEHFTGDYYSFTGMVTRLKKKPACEFALDVKYFQFTNYMSGNYQKVTVQPEDLPTGSYNVSVGSATAVDNVVVNCDGIYTLKVYTISNGALTAVYQYVYFSDFNNAGNYVGKLANNTATLSNTYGTIAVAAANKGVKVSTVKGYRIDVSVKPFD